MGIRFIDDLFSLKGKVALVTSANSGIGHAMTLARQTIIGRNGILEDLDGLTVCLSSSASGYITGQTIFLDGGWSAR